ncbi:hypothetical protein LTS15_010585 [Exophiala xenobiotica]|nr:hypothetical protein LTS15_010585 [Exophiala xenobiotica]
MALGQYVSARSSRDDFQAIGCRFWTIKHSFYADMGGFVLHPSGWKQFPVSAKQLCYLVAHGYIDFPELKKEEIGDKDKADGLARFVTSCQIIWFSLNVIARPTQRLAVSTLEMTTIGFIFCTLGVNICWKNKPMDVFTPTPLRCNYTMEQILETRTSENAPAPNAASQEAGTQHVAPQDVDSVNASPRKDATQTTVCQSATPQAVIPRSARKSFPTTPLDFVSRDEWTATLLWKYNVNILRKLRIVRQRDKVWPAQRTSSFNFPKLPRGAAGLTVILTMLYSAIFMAAWNFEFPSAMERLLWRISSSMTICLTIAMGLVEVLPTTLEKARNEKPPDVEAEKGILTRFDHACRGAMRRFEAKRINNSPLNDPNQDVPLKSVLFTLPICAAYTVCRVYILIEDIIGLRALPASAFQTVNWTSFWPHF